MKKYDDSLFYDSLLYICPTPSAPPLLHHIHNTNLTFQWRNPGRNKLFSPRFFFTIFKPFFRDKNKPRYEQQQPKKVTAFCISICMCRRAFFFFAPFTIPCGSFYLFVSLAKTRNVCNDNVAFQMIANFSWKKKKDDKEEASSCLLFLCSIKNYLKFSFSWKFSCFPFTSSFFFFSLKIHNMKANKLYRNSPSRHFLQRNFLYRNLAAKHFSTFPSFTNLFCSFYFYSINLPTPTTE